MNIITGSAGGLGKRIYGHFKKNNKDVFGIDRLDSSSTDLQLDLGNKEEIKLLKKKIPSKVDSITFTHAIGNSKKDISNFSEDEYRYINAESNFQIIDSLSSNLEFQASILFISSVHSQLTNADSSNYALSKSYLEALYRRMCLSEKYNKFNKLLICLGAMDTGMLKDNIENVESFRNSLPSKNIINPDTVADFIYDFHEKYKIDFDCSIFRIDNGVSYLLATD
jgi:short-subunit dehydrogenase